MGSRKASAAIVAAVLVPSLVIGGAVPAAAAADEPALPSHPFFARMELKAGQAKAVGVAGLTLGVSSITITSFNATDQTVYIFSAIVAGKSCDTAVTGGGNLPTFYVLVGPRQTLHLAFPTPLVVPLFQGVSCLAAEVTTVHSSTMEVAVNGFSQ
jgi:hypothetical protein